MARKQVRIGKDGNVITDGDGEGGTSGARRCGLPSYVDVFGFHLELKHFVLLFVLIALTMGGVGGTCQSIWFLFYIHNVVAN
eukprot:scaffold14981_cov66-Cyclotella_meneghiniana.AAC.3